MSEELKKYFKKNRIELDVDSPPADLWAKIDVELGKQKEDKKVISLVGKEKKVSNKRSVFGNWLKAAAVLLFTFWLGYFVANDKSEIAETRPVPIDVSKLDLSKINEEMGETENFYLANINLVANELKSYQKEYPEMVMEFLLEHENLDEVYNELKLHLIDNADNEQILNLMIQNLQMRNEILIQQKNILQKMANLKSVSDEKTYL